MAYPRIGCPICESTFGQEKRFLDHLTEIHGIGNHQEFYVKTVLGGNWPTCGCGCGTRLTWNCWKKGFTSQFLRGHNAVLDSTFHDAGAQARMAEKRVGRTSWNTGLTKESSEKIRRMASKTSRTIQEKIASGNLVDWRREDPKRARLAAQRISQTKKRKFAAGDLVPWNKGLTKEDDSRVAKAAASITSRCQQREAGRRITVEELLTRVERFSDRFEMISDPEEYRQRRVQRLVFRCTSCDVEQEKSLAMLEESPVCFACHPKGSTGQLEILDYVRSLGIEAVSSDRSVIPPMELDVWVPEHRLAIEYDGLYWHSSAVNADPRAPLRKLELARGAGINLLTVFEDEWRDRQDIVKGMIRHRLRMQPRRFMARSLECRELSKEETKAFFQANHLEGHARSRTAYGLVSHEGEVLAGMSLRRPFHRRYAEWYELARSCCHRDTVIPGWLGRLTKAIKQRAAQDGKLGVMTYVDSRVGAGGGYAAGGWDLISESTGPRFWWTDFTHRYNRFKYKADRSRGMTQAQVAEEAGVEMVYGVPNSRWEVCCHSQEHAA